MDGEMPQAGIGAAMDRLTPTMSRRAVLAVAGGVALAGILGSCSNDNATVPAGSGSGTAATDVLVAAVGSFATETVDPHVAPNNSNLRPVMWAISETLARRDLDGKLVPNLALSWETSSDALTWTFTLRPGVMMQDGSTFAGRDVKTAIDRVTMNPEFTYFAQLRESLEAVNVLGDGRVSVKLKKPYPTILDELPVPIPTAYYEQVGNAEFGKRPLGAGAFKFVSQQIHGSVTMERFDGYFDKSRMPNFKTLKMLIIPDESARIAGLLNGQIDIAHGLSANSVKQLEGAPNIRVLRKDNASFGAVNFQDLYFPDRPSPFLDVRVRKALIYALDRQSMVTSLYQGYATVVANFTLPITLGNDASLAPYPYDPQRAKQLLADAGAENLTFDFRSYTVDNVQPNVQRLSQAMVGYWAQIGAKVNYQAVDNAVVLAQHRAHTLTGIRIGGWPANVFYKANYSAHNTLYGAGFSTSVRDPALDAIIDRLDAATDSGREESIANEYSRYVYDNVPIFPVLGFPSLVGIGPKVRDFQLQAGNPYLGPFWSLQAA
ncbi:ABC transporter substrate-binding protein [Pseudonocardia sp. GCM10023141]|uniref:ABC transporter substrate-binding protein n=1 Tax=Pseudonocardia sp. GCM10023141 TaxID=3252653 RepID=UPI00361A43FC